jgi:hypothetical protein
MDGVVEIITVESTVAARNGDADAPVPLFLLEVGEQFPQVLDALSGEGHDGIVLVDIKDGEAAVLRLHIQRDLVQPILIFAQHPGDAANGEDVTWRRHGQAARATGGDRTQFHGNSSGRREAG